MKKKLTELIAKKKYVKKLAKVKKKIYKWKVEDYEELSICGNYDKIVAFSQSKGILFTSCAILNFSDT